MVTAVSYQTATYNSIESAEGVDFFWNGIAYLENGEYQEAKVAFDQAIQLNPDQFEYFQYRGIASFCLSDFDAALADLNHALALTDQSEALGEIHFFLAGIYAEMGNAEESFHHLVVSAEHGCEMALAILRDSL